MVYAAAFVEDVAHGSYKGAKLFLVDQSKVSEIDGKGRWDSLKNAPSYRFRFLRQKSSGNQSDVTFIDPQGTERTIHMVKRREKDQDAWMVDSIK